MKIIHNHSKRKKFRTFMLHLYNAIVLQWFGMELYRCYHSAINREKTTGWYIKYIVPVTGYFLFSTYTEERKAKTYVDEEFTPLIYIFMMFMAGFEVLVIVVLVLLKDCIERNLL